MSVSRHGADSVDWKLARGYELFGSIGLDKARLHGPAMGMRLTDAHRSRRQPSRSQRSNEHLQVFELAEDVGRDLGSRISAWIIRVVVILK